MQIEKSKPVSKSKSRSASAIYIKAGVITTCLRALISIFSAAKKNIIIGGSGAGKTVLMRQIVVLDRADQGSILLDGEEITKLGEVRLGEVRRRFGMVFQGSALFDSMSVFDNVAFPLRERGNFSRREIRERVMAKLGALGVDDAADRYPVTSPAE